MRVVIAIAFMLIIASLGSALFYLMRDKGKSNKTVYSLALRVGLSIALFLFILFASWMGGIHRTGIPLQQ
ncbi:MAG: twin transmembrane helix small protein [Candidatus Protistobacter heckmanni]|nr:twin transmembrane helix small protein [Candidatus Protistobacter heckmanni]